LRRQRRPSDDLGLVSIRSDIFDTPAPRCFSMGAGRPFLIDLARMIRASVPSGDQTALSDTLILTPTRRAVRALGEAFLATSPSGAATLLPRMKALGDIEEDEFAVFEGPAADEVDLPPAISSMQRRLALAKMIAARGNMFDGQERWAGALAAADELAKLLDSFYTEEIDPAALHTLAPDAHAKHWARSLEFLSIVTQAWPAYLAEAGLSDPADRRAKLIDRQTRLWAQSPPQSPIIIAGTTGSTPSVARMMKLVATLPKGCVVLPGLDLASSSPVWEATDEPHPQSGLKHLLESLGLTRTDVAEWPGQKSQTSASRSGLLSLVLRPAQSSNDWRTWVREQSNDALLGALSGLTLVEAGDEELEASAIALKLREAVATPEKTAMLVTPDRDLARRVAMKMRRWAITVDDSGGVPFANTPCGTYLRLSAIWLCDVSDPAALMAFVRHPLFGAALSAADRRGAINALDHTLRGLRPARNIEGLSSKITASHKGKAAAPVLKKLKQALMQQAPDDASFQARLQAHLTIAETLCATADQDGGARLWSGEDGAAGADALGEIGPVAALISNDDAADYPDIFLQLIAKTTVRRRAPAHPRILILGPLEARLQNADMIILGGLNEGVWPRDAAIDPFLSRQMRKELGLPSPEQRIGLSAHDFAQLATADQVMLTRTTRSGGSPTKPSRWLVRLKNILTNTEALKTIDVTNTYAALSKRLDAPDGFVRIAPPNPRPPVSARPDKLFVTRIERLLRDPYGLYASHILRLPKLDALNQPFGPAQLGALMHRVFFDHAGNPPQASLHDNVEALKSLIDKHANEYGLTSDHAIFWRGAIDNALGWFAQWDTLRRQDGAPLVLEGKGEWTFHINSAPFTIQARADRIDLLTSGGAYIIDYKSGQPPTLKQQKKFSPQLPLTGLITMQGGFDKLGAQAVAGFDYVRVLRRTGTSKDQSGAHGEEAAALVTQASEGLKALIAHFNDPTTTYPSQPRAEYADQYGDYDHLARRRERDVQGDGE